MMGDLWQECKTQIENWDLKTPEERNEALRVVDKLKREELEKLGHLINRIKTIKTLEAVLRERTAEPIPDVYIRAFENLGGKR